MNDTMSGMRIAIIGGGLASPETAVEAFTL